MNKAGYSFMILSYQCMGKDPQPICLETHKNEGEGPTAPS